MKFVKFGLLIPCIITPFLLSTADNKIGVISSDISESVIGTAYNIFTNRSNIQLLLLLLYAIYLKCAMLVFSSTVSDLKKNIQSDNFYSYICLYSVSIIFELLYNYIHDYYIRFVIRNFIEAAYNAYDSIMEFNNSITLPEEYVSKLQSACNSLRSVFEFFTFVEISACIDIYTIFKSSYTASYFHKIIFAIVCIVIVAIGFLILSSYGMSSINMNRKLFMLVTKSDIIQSTRTNIFSVRIPTGIEKLKDFIVYQETADAADESNVKLKTGFIIIYRFLFILILCIINYTFPENIGELIYIIDTLVNHIFVIVYKYIYYYTQLESWNTFYNCLSELRSNAILRRNMPKSLILSNITSIIPTTIIYSTRDTDGIYCQSPHSGSINTSGDICVSNISPDNVMHIFTADSTCKIPSDLDIIQIRRGDRILLSGDSGSGKTSFINAFCGQSEYMTMKFINIVDDISASRAERIIVDPLAYRHACIIYSQTFRESFQLEKITLRELFEAVSPIRDGIQHSNDIQIAKYCYKSKIDIQKIGYDTILEHLSSGERTRICLALLLWIHATININNQECSCIILDEPEQGLNYELSIPIIRDLLSDPEYNTTTFIVISHIPELHNIINFNSHIHFAIQHCV